MGALLWRPVARALFLFVAVLVVGPAWATDPGSTVTCGHGQWQNQFGECVDACKENYAPGIMVMDGMAVPTRSCFTGEGVTATAGGESSTSFNRPACWHYTAGQTEKYPNYAIYKVYVNPRDTCDVPGRDECGKLGCEQAGSGTGGTSGGSSIAASGVPSPVFEGTLSNYSTGATPYGGGWPTPGGVQAGGGVADVYCSSRGWGQEALCRLNQSNYRMEAVSGAKPQQDSEQSLLYIGSASDVNCSVWWDTATNWTKSSGTCNGTFLAKYNPTNHAMYCKTGTQNRDYSGPNIEGYNASAASPGKACLLSEYYARDEPVVGSTANPNATGVKYPFTHAFYACEYTLTKPAGTNAYVYRGAGQACGTVGSMGTSAGPQQEMKYVPAPDDYECYDGHPRDGWSNAKCNGTYVPVTASDTPDMFFGMPGHFYVRYNGDGSKTVIPINKTGIPSGFSYNSEVLQGDPSVGTKPTYGSQAGGTGSGGGLGGLPGSSSAEMPSSTFDPWYTPKYENGPKGVWQARSATVKNSAIGQWVKGFEITGGGSFNPHWLLDFSQMGFGAFEIEIPAAVMLALRYFVLVSAAFTVRKIIFGG